MKGRTWFVLFLFACALALWGQSPPGSLSALQGSLPNAGGPISQMQQPASAKELLLDLGDLLETLRQENENSIPLSETRIEILTKLTNELSMEIKNLNLSLASLEETKALYSGLSEALARLSTEFKEIQTKSENLTRAYDSLSTSFEKFKKSLDRELAAAKAEAISARNASKISFIATGASIGAAAGFVIGGPVGAAIGGSIGGVFAFLLRPG